MFQNWNAARVFYMNVFFYKNWPSSEKLWCHFHFVFRVMPDKAAFERITLITAVTGETVLSANKNKTLQKCVEKVLKFWAMYYYYELGYYYYYHLVPFFWCWMVWCSVLCKWCVHIVCILMFLKSVQHIGQIIVVFNRASDRNCLALHCSKHLLKLSFMR